MDGVQTSRRLTLVGADSLGPARRLQYAVRLALPPGLDGRSDPAGRSGYWQWDDQWVPPAVWYTPHRPNWSPRLPPRWVHTDCARRPAPQPGTAPANHRAALLHCRARVGGCDTLAVLALAAGSAA